MNKIERFCGFILMRRERAFGSFSKNVLLTMKQMAAFINKNMRIQNFKITKTRVL